MRQPWAFSIRYQRGGKRYEVVLGWTSEGWTEDKAALELAKLKEAYKTGEGEVSLAEKRRKAEKRKAQEEARKASERTSILLKDFWKQQYWPAQAHKAKGSLVAESCLYETWIKPVLSETPVVNIVPSGIERIKANMLAAGKAPSSIKYAFAVISQIWNLAKRERLVIGDSPTKLVALPKRDNRRGRFLNQDEAKKLLAALKVKSIHTHDMALLALYCGLRFGEIAALTWRDVDLQGGTLSIRDPKARTDRVAFITATVRAMLEERLELSDEQGDRADSLIFKDRHGSRMVAVSDTFTRLVDKMFNVGVTDSRQKVCFHTLRHTFASWLVQRSVDLYSVKELMGHASFKMTQRYSHLSPDGLRKAAAAIESPGA